jgi:hypothetical protein
MNGPNTMRARQCIPAESGPYRYTLEVAFGGSGIRLAAILKNPSMAGVERSDATIGKMESWARRRGYGSLVVVNLFARRATNPTDLNAVSYVGCVGAENDRFILDAAADADITVAAWGGPNGVTPDRYERRIHEVLALLVAHRLHIVGPLTRTGYPRHGLLWNGDCELAIWR